MHEKNCTPDPCSMGQHVLACEWRYCSPSRRSGDRRMDFRPSSASWSRLFLDARLRTKPYRIRTYAMEFAHPSWSRICSYCRVLYVLLVCLLIFIFSVPYSFQKFSTTFLALFHILLLSFFLNVIIIISYYFLFFCISVLIIIIFI